jgi:hypothetical protein
MIAANTPHLVLPRPAGSALLPVRTSVIVSFPPAGTPSIDRIMSADG